MIIRLVREYLGMGRYVTREQKIDLYSPQGVNEREEVTGLEECTVQAGTSSLLSPSPVHCRSPHHTLDHISLPLGSGSLVKRGPFQDPELPLGIGTMVEGDLERIQKTYKGELLA